jgi:hypothetical protein
MIAVLPHLSWGLVVLLSFAALGRLVARVVHPAGIPDTFLATGWGLAAMTILGGFLNLFGVATAPVLVALVLGVILVDLLVVARSLPGIGQREPSPGLVPERGPAGRGDRIAIVLLLLFVSVKYVSSLGYSFTPGDDKLGYLFQLARFHQTGSIGLDPFSEHQLVSLNGQIFLLGLIAAGSPLKYAYLLDPGLCWIMIGGLTWSIVRRDLGGSIRESAAATALVLLVEGCRTQNLGGHLTGAVLYLTLIQTAYRGSQEQGKLERGSVLLLALVIASLAALKGTFFIFAVLFAVSWYSVRMRHSHSVGLMRELSLVGLVASILLLPWMWQQYLSGGTPFYPLLGKGYLLSGLGFGITSDSIATKLKAVAHSLLNGEFIPAVLGLLLLTKNPFAGHSGRWHVWGASLCGALVGSLFISYHMAGGTGVPRYCQPFLYAALIPVGLGGFFSTPPSKRGMALAVCLALFVGNQSGDEVTELYTRLHHLREFVARRWGPVLDDRDRQQIKKAQASIPVGARILVSVENGAELDFGRNPIWNLDHTGMVSPPPGMPVTADRSALSDFILQRAADLPVPVSSNQVLEYLRQVGIDFLILQRGEDCLWSWREDQAIEEKPVWMRLVQTVERVVRRPLLGLMEQCNIVYDDGDMVVLDLRSRSTASHRLRGTPVKSSSP